VFGGMIAAAVLGTLLVPVLYAGIQRSFPGRRDPRAESDDSGD
jgi:hypothetical protein